MPEGVPQQNGFRKSESIAALAAALAAAQGQIQGAIKDKMAEVQKDGKKIFGYSYADLASVMEAARAPLAKNGLSVMQFPQSGANHVEVETVLAHSSGEWVSGSLRLPVGKLDAQGYGMSITYAKRYGFSAIVGVWTEDDDGTRATESSGKLREETLQELEVAADTGSEAFNIKFKSISQEARNLVNTDKNTVPNLRTKATISDWEAKLLNDPTIEQFNAMLPDLKKIKKTPAEQPVWAMFVEHGRQCGLVYDGTKKQFVKAEVADAPAGS